MLACNGLADCCRRIVGITEMKDDWDDVTDDDDMMINCQLLRLPCVVSRALGLAVYFSLRLVPAEMFLTTTCRHDCEKTLICF